jgi:hypothetical protein
MNNIVIGMIFAGALLFGMLLLMEVGRRFGSRRTKRDEEGARAGLGAIEGSVFALMGLLIAFTFTGAASRFDHRRELIAQEVNAIGTAWLRLDILQPGTRESMRELFRRYLDARLDAYRSVDDLKLAWERLDQSVAIQGQLWNVAVAAAEQEPSKPIAMFLLPALNDMFDIAAMRAMATSMHPPIVVFLVLGTLTLLAALMAGYGMSRGSRSWTHIIVFAVIMAGSVYLIIDMEYPRLGLVRVASFDDELTSLRRSMDAPATSTQ